MEGQISASLAQGTFEGFNNQTTQTVDDIIAQIEARDAYDREYIANKTRDMEQLQADLAELQQQRTDEIMAGLNSSYAAYSDCIAGDRCGNRDNSLFGIFDDLSQDILTDLDGMNATFLETDAEVAIFIDKFQRAMTLLNDKLDEIRKWNLCSKIDLLNISF